MMPTVHVPGLTNEMMSELLSHFEHCYPADFYSGKLVFLQSECSRVCADRCFLIAQYLRVSNLEHHSMNVPQIVFLTWVFL